MTQCSLVKLPMGLAASAFCRFGFFLDFMLHILEMGIAACVSSSNKYLVSVAICCFGTDTFLDLMSFNIENSPVYGRQ